MSYTVMYREGKFLVEVPVVKDGSRLAEEVADSEVKAAQNYLSQLGLGDKFDVYARDLRGHKIYHVDNELRSRNPNVRITAVDSMPNAVAWALAQIADIKRERNERAELSDLLRGRDLKLINPIHFEPRLIPNKGTYKKSVFQIHNLDKRLRVK